MEYRSCARIEALEFSNEFVVVKIQLYRGRLNTSHLAPNFGNF